jgi:uncharacterized membrane protein
LRFGDMLADKISAALGTWTFLIAQTIVLALWVAANALRWVGVWDPYPFILLNLGLSFQAAYAAPVIMMATRRIETHDRLRSKAFQDSVQELLAEIGSLTGKIDTVLDEVIIRKLDAAIALLDEVHDEIADDEIGDETDSDAEV